MSAISDFLIWMEEEHPEVVQDIGIPPQYANEYLDMITDKRKLEETE